MLDGLVDASWNSGELASRLSPEDQRRLANAQALAHLLCPTNSAASPCTQDLIAKTLAKVQNTTPQHIALSQEPVLSPEDEDALDALVAAGFRAEGVSSSLRDRAVSLNAMGDLLRDCPLPPKQDIANLVDRTLAGISSVKIAPREQEPVTAGRIGFRMADMLSLAAVLILGVSVLWPLLSSFRTQSQRMACGSNMSAVATAMGSYASDFRDSLPIASASFTGGTWWDVGTSPERSNAANLFQLAKARYAKLQDLACPGNASACTKLSCENMTDWSCSQEVSYSYRIMSATNRPSWGQRAGSAPMIILSDKSPVIMRAKRGEAINPNENSVNHGGEGQWTIRTDGSALWLNSPEVQGDNIWLPGSIEAAIKEARSQMKRLGATNGTLIIRGNELPSSVRDIFLGP